MSIASPSFAHLDHMCDDRGIFEHAELTRPRRGHGYCTDDNARLLLVASRAERDAVVDRLSRVSLQFVLDAHLADGRCHNRMNRLMRWTDQPTTEDHWGRSVWALGTAAAQHHDPVIRVRARAAFDRCIEQRSPWPRAMAFAAVGAAEVLDAGTGDGAAARRLLADTVAAIGRVPQGVWPWPEPRLSYANAVLAEALVVAGRWLDDDAILDDGLRMLSWLLDTETVRGHLSVTSIDGRGPEDSGPRFDQQPIEAAAMADACWRASDVTGDAQWSRGVAVAAGWFHGDNDTGVSMCDEDSGGCFDGLRHDGVNLNEGAESTLAMVSTFQRARSFAGAR